MLIFTVVYSEEREEVIDLINEMRKYLKNKDYETGISESIENNVHFIKIFCMQDEISTKLQELFNIYMANIMYKVVINEFFKERVGDFLSENYFFLKYEELKDIKDLSSRILRNTGAILNDDEILYMNYKNTLIEKIKICIEENKEINIEGFLRFRMRELEEDIEGIMDKIVERYMVEKEYGEFIKLLKYFVEIQESKIDEVNIIINNRGEYLIQDKDGKDIIDKMTEDLSDSKFSGVISMEDILISGLITNCPKNIIIHHEENCLNKEVLETIKSVFENRVRICNSCALCNKNSNNPKELVGKNKKNN